MTQYGLKAAAVLIGAACIFAPLRAEPPGQAPTATAANSVPPAAPPAAACPATGDQASADCNGIFAVMMEYQKTMNKEAREDRRLGRDSKAAAIEAQTGKIKADNKAIDQGMAESRERAELATAPQAPAPAGGIAAAKPPAASGTIRQLCQAGAVDCPPPCEGPCK